MNKGGLAILGVGVFIFICGYLSEEKVIMGFAAFIILAGFGLLAAKTSNGKNPVTGQVYFRCPNCKRNAGEEIPKEKQENGKSYKCTICNYKW
ncbi:MAG: hypothetical protein E7533_03680 [Ruminococcaceae bacterium]|nr:hypothetical protein [Oscillospiraceae bacterium]